MIDAIPWIVLLVLLDLVLWKIYRKLKKGSEFNDVDELAKRKT